MQTLQKHLFTQVTKPQTLQEYLFTQVTKPYGQ